MKIENMIQHGVIQNWIETKSIDGMLTYLNPDNVEYLVDDGDEYIFGLIDGTEFRALKN